jgi:hypothetical protein
MLNRWLKVFDGKNFAGIPGWRPRNIQPGVRDHDQLIVLSVFVGKPTASDTRQSGN